MSVLYDSLPQQRVDFCDKRLHGTSNTYHGFKAMPEVHMFFCFKNLLVVEILYIPLHHETL